MTKEEAIKYLQQIYPNGGHCWLDEQRIDAIGMAVKALQEEQMIVNFADAMIGLPYENKEGGYTHLIDVSRPLPVGSNKIAIIFKED